MKHECSNVKSSLLSPVQLENSAEFHIRVDNVAAAIMQKKKSCFLISNRSFDNHVNKVAHGTNWQSTETFVTFP